MLRGDAWDAYAGAEPDTVGAFDAFEAELGEDPGVLVGPYGCVGGGPVHLVEGVEVGAAPRFDADELLGGVGVEDVADEFEVVPCDGRVGGAFGWSAVAAGFTHGRKRITFPPWWRTHLRQDGTTSRFSCPLCLFRALLFGEWHCEWRSPKGTLWTAPCSDLHKVGIMALVALFSPKSTPRYTVIQQLRNYCTLLVSLPLIPYILFYCKTVPPVP